MSPKVSVILPSYNYAHYLDERITSLLNQTYKDFELIIVDDASTDNSVEVIQKYTEDPRIRTQFYTENSGLPYKRWNDGAELSQGEYLLFAGADDSCLPTMLEKLVEKLDQNPSVGIAFCQSLEIDGEGKEIRSLIERTNDLDKEHWKNDYVNSGKNECRFLAIKNTIPNASAVLLRRSTFEAAGMFDVNLRLVADWMLWARMLLISDIAYVAEPLNYFRVHRTTVRSKTRSEGLHIQEYYKVASFILENAELPQSVTERAYNWLLNRWVNAVVKLMVSKPGKAIQKARQFHKLAREVDANINRRLIVRFLRDISTFGFFALKERAAQY